MRKQIIEQAAIDVAEQVRTVEHVIDTALTEIAELQGRMLRARAVAHVGVRTGQDALQHLSDTLVALVSARGGMGNCHAALIDARMSFPASAPSASATPLIARPSKRPRWTCASSPEGLTGPPDGGPVTPPWITNISSPRYS